LLEPFTGASGIHVKFKIVGVDIAGTSVETVAIYHADARTPEARVQQNATWHCRWRRAGDEPPQLTSIRVKGFEEITSPGGDGFRDCTEAVLGRNETFRPHMLRGLNHWLSRIERLHGMQMYLHNGLAVDDVNGDGLEDLYVCQPGGLPNRLYLQQPDGTATDRSSWAGVDYLDRTSGALLVDLDNDADPDLVLSLTSGTLLLLANDSTGRFTLLNTLKTPDENLHGLSAADYDKDGDLDLYVTTDFAQSRERPGEVEPAFLYHDANDGGANVLFRNDMAPAGDGPWVFTDVTSESGLDRNNRRHSLAAGWEDYDDDGDLDLYVANDYGQNCLYRNDGSPRYTFTEVAPEVGVVDFGSGMSVSWGDYNRDGRMDLYVGNMYSFAGNRITRQARFKPDFDASTRAVYARFAKGNSLFENDGSGAFREAGGSQGVEIAGWAWSSLFADVNNDGWEDLLVANGHITTDDTGDL
jgi:hypothetical protein